MSTAWQKNRTALARLLGSEALADRLMPARIGVWSTEVSDQLAGRLLAESLGDVLGRLWQRLDTNGPLALICAESARSAAQSASYSSEIEVQWQPPYDFVIGIGTDPPVGSGPGMRIGASGWRVLAGSRAIVDTDPNPVGPVLAAGLASAEAFKVFFADALGGRAGDRLGELDWSVWSYGASHDNPRAEPLNLREVHLFGAGAVTHGLAWVLTRWPEPVTGTAHIVDQDVFDDSNAQRYAGLSHSDLGQPKARTLATRLGVKLPRGTFHPYDINMNALFDREGSELSVRLAVAGLDSPEGRRQLALKLPLRTVNMWTDAFHLGAARFGFNGDWPCLFCAYPEAVTAELDETVEIHRQTQIAPHRVRELLHTNGPLTEAEVQLLAQRYGLPPAALAGKPLRSVRGHLCATGRVNVVAGAGDADVPLAHSSLMAGVFGFVELIRELQSAAGDPARWVYNTLHPPRHGFLEASGRRASCFLCADDVAREILTGSNRR